MRSLALLLFLGCSAQPHGFGIITDDGRAAFREFCGHDLVHSINLSMFGDYPDHDDRFISVDHCAFPGGTGHLAFDAKNGRLWEFFLAMDVKVGSRSTDFDLLVQRILLPTLDPDERQAYLQQLRPTLSVPWDHEEDWRQGTTRISVNIEPVEHSGDSGTPVRRIATLMVVAADSTAWPRPNGPKWPNVSH